MILDIGNNANNTQPCQDGMGNPNAQSVRIEADSSNSPRRLLFKGMTTGTQDSAQVTYLNGYNDAQFDASFTGQCEVAFTGTYSGITASHCSLGVDGVIVLIDGVSQVAFAYCRNPASMAR